MQVAQLRIPKMPNSVTDATKLESVGKKWLEAYCLFLRRPGRKREEEQWKGVCGYRGKWRLRCKTSQTTKEGGPSDGRCANTYGQQCGGPADPNPRGWWGEPQLTTSGLSISPVPGRFDVGGGSKDGQNCILIHAIHLGLGRKGWQNCILTAAVCN